MTVELRNLSVSYGETRVLQDLSLGIGRGEILMLVGPTGCGKTTLLRALAGLVPIAGGEIRLGERCIVRGTSLPPEKRNVGMVFQDFALFPHLNVERNIGFRLRERGPMDRWIAALNLGPWRQAMPETLSGGQKQRVALARALAHAPGLVLLDEPLSNLDASLKENLRWTIRDALKEAGVAAVWVTHDQDEAMSVGDRVGVLNGGRLEQIGTPEDCFARPASRFVAGFLGEACFLEGRLDGEKADTSLGSVAVDRVGATDGAVDVLVRPDDLTLRAGGDANGRLKWSRFEGGTRLCAVQLDTGEELRARVAHEDHYSAGDPVRVSIVARHPLVAFPSAKPRAGVAESRMARVAG